MWKALLFFPIRDWKKTTLKSSKSILHKTEQATITTNLH
jgi:hypothetical protein